MDAPDPSAIGNSFIVQYYTVLNKSPESLHNFYSAKSECTYGYEDEEGSSARGLEGIQRVLAANEYENCRVALSSLDCQGSVNGGIFVSVVGKLINKDGSPQKFIQSFFLERVNQAYYVLNDVFRFLREEEPYEEDEQEEEEYAEEEPAQEEERAPSPVPEPEPAPAPVAAPAPVVETPAPVAPVAAAPVPAKVEATPAPAPAPAKVETSAPAAPVAEKKATTQEKKESSGKTSWASIVSTASEPAKADTERPVATKPPAKAAPAKAAPAQQQQQQRERPAVQLPQRSNRPSDRPNSPILMEGCSIYASGVSGSVTQEQVATVFSQYGTVRNVVLKPLKGFAFVEYESPAAVQQALNNMKNNQPTLEGKVLLIEERKPRANVPAASPRGRGRGGPGARGGRGGGAPSFGTGAPAGQAQQQGQPGKEGGFTAGDKQRRGGGPRGFPSPRDARRGGGPSGERRPSVEARGPQQQQRPNTVANNNINNNTTTNTTTSGFPKPGQQQPQQPKK